VHAAAQVISLKAAITTPDENLDKLRENINAKLPNDIRVLDIVKAVRNFSAKTSRDKVRYQYMIPSYVLQEKGDLVKTFDEYIRTSGVESSSSSTNYTSFSILTDEDREKVSELREIGYTILEKWELLGLWRGGVSAALGLMDAASLARGTARRRI